MEKNRPRIHELPYATRRRILYASVSAITLLLVVLWMKILPLQITYLREAQPQQTSNGEQISEALEELKKALEEPVFGPTPEATTQTTTPNASPENTIDPQVIEELKNRIEQQATSTVITNP